MDLDRALAPELNPPYGGALKQLVAQGERAREKREESLHLPSWDLTQRQLWDLELLMNGAFSPLDGFMTKADYETVCREMRLQDGTLWPIPVTLDVSETLADALSPGASVALRHPEGMALAVLHVGDIWKPDLEQEAELVYGTQDEMHPGVTQLLHRTNPVYLGGSIEGLELPPHHTFRGWRHTPVELRQLFKERGWERVVGFQTRNPMHKAHVELVKRAAASADANILIHPAVGRTGPQDLDYFVRVRCYRKVLRHLPHKTMLSLLPLAMRLAGPRSALWHAIIRKNYGCSHFIIGRDHSGPGQDGNGNEFYPPYAAQELALKHEDELGIGILPFEELVYVKDYHRFLPRSEVPKGAKVLRLSGTELRRLLRAGEEIPDWYTYPEVARELRRSYAPRPQQGFTVFFTGLSGAGKSTIAQVLMAKLLEIGGRPVTLLDGDIVRKHLSSELGFSKEHRDINVKRIGFVASEITKNRGVAICAPIAPYEATRREVRELIHQYGGFVEVYVSTPLEVCEARDRKGLYAKARAGLIKDFTGISDPYEPPEHPDVVVDASRVTPEEAVGMILDHLKLQGYLETG